MSTTTLSQSVQVKVTLPLQLYKQVKRKAERFGLTVSGYIKHLLLKDVWDDVDKFSLNNEE